jgi:hypothetical protein
MNSRTRFVSSPTFSNRTIVVDGIGLRRIARVV